MPDRRAEEPQRDTILEQGPAIRTLRAIVDTLLDGAPPELAVQVRTELPDLLKAAARPYDAEAPASVEELLERFRVRARLPPGDVLHEAQIAVGLVEEMLLPETHRDLRASFPDEFGILFERKG